MKYSNRNVFLQNSMKDRLTHFNISVIVKCRRENQRDKSKMGNNQNT